MRTHKLADKYTETDLASYFAAKATELGVRDEFQSVTPIVRAYRNLLRAFNNDRHLLVMATDHLLTGTFVSQVGANERLLTIPVFDVALRQLGGSRQPWKFMYLKRFAENERELLFFEYYLGVLDDSRTALPLDLPPEGETWQSRTAMALSQLQLAEKRLIARCLARGGLVEIFYTPEPAPPPLLKLGGDSIMKKGT